MASPNMLDCVLAVLSSDNKVLLRQIFSDLSSQMESWKLLKSGEHFSLIEKSLYRDICAKTAYLLDRVEAMDMTHAALR